MTEHYLVGLDPASGGYQNGYQDYVSGYDTYEKAEIAAKKKTSKSQSNFTVFKAFATAKAVVPDIEMVKH